MFKRSDGRWCEKITIKGKTQYFYGKTKAELRVKLLAEADKTAHGLKFAALALKWKEKHYPTLAPSTQRGYTASFNRLIAEFGAVYISDITAKDIQAMLTELQQLQYSKKVISTQLNLLRMIYRFAVLEGYADNNPAEAVQLPKHLPQAQRELPTPEDIAVVKSSSALLPFFLLYTGLRRGEALALEWADIDFNRKIIKVNKAVGYKDNVPYLKLPKTAAGVRTVPLLDPLAARLQPLKSEGLIFTDNSGDYLHGSKVTRRWKKWQQDNNTSVTMHQLRHAYATILFEADIPIKAAQQLLGHSDYQTTANIYTHIRAAQEAATANKLNDYLNRLEDAKKPLQ